MARFKEDDGLPYEHKLARRKVRKLHPETKARIRQLAENGKPYHVLARQFGLTSYQVQYFLTLPQEQETDEVDSLIRDRAASVMGDTD